MSVDDARRDLLAKPPEYCETIEGSKFANDFQCHEAHRAADAGRDGGACGLPSRDRHGQQAQSTAGQLVGAGSTFVQPLVSQWQAAYPSVNGTNIVYQPIGSGGGIQAITNRTVDFGASDAPLTPDQLATCKGCVQIPWALGGTSVMVNLKTNAHSPLHITGPVLAKIYLGQITSWDDAAIKALNPGISLPNQKITPVYRSDGSGTSYNFTDYLSSRQPGVQVEGRRLDAAAVPDGRRRQGLVRRRRRRQEHGRRHRLCRHRVRGDEPHPGDGGSERGRASTRPRASSRSLPLPQRSRTSGRPARCTS